MATKKTKAKALGKSVIIAYRVSPAFKSAADSHCKELGLPSYTVAKAAKDAFRAVLHKEGLLSAP